MTAIFRHPASAASVLCAALTACGGRAPSGAKGAEPAPVRVVPLASAIVLETSGPPPSDTAVTFTAGEPRVIVLRHGPPENVVFAEVSFAPRTFHADSGRSVKVEIHPRPGVYGIDLITSVPFSEGASVVFRYPRYFSAPAKARAVYGSDALYERALGIGQVLGTGQSLSLLPTTRPGPDNLEAALPAPGTYLVAAPESP
ncbi:MAG TPA: hypothetical protein VJQ46_15605 [Gemmatimonadales bacterium]|nr:hypothetical protein [Gemmatimonadales bacterium]